MIRVCRVRNNLHVLEQGRVKASINISRIDSHMILAIKLFVEDYYKLTKKFPESRTISKQVERLIKQEELCQNTY